MIIASRPAWVRFASIGVVVLVSCATAFAQDAVADPAQKLEAIVKRYEAQDSEAYDAYRAAKTDEERTQAKKRRPGKEFVQEFRELATSARGSATAVSAWIWVLQIGPNVGDVESSRQALDTLLADYLESPELVELAPQLRYAGDTLGAESVEKALRKLVDGSPHATVKASALFTLASILASDGKPGSPQFKEARELFNRLLTDYGDTRTRRGKTYGSVAENSLFEIDRLQIGMVAPDFEALDENGVAFKLSDYRGKVVVIDFWGFW